MRLEEWRDVLGEGLTVSLELPVASSDRMPSRNEGAARLLDAIAALEDGVLGRGLKEEPASPELQRIELKIDLLTDLVSSLLADRIPPRRRVWISGDGLVLPSAVLDPGADRVALYPSHWLAQPLVLELDGLVCRDGCRGASWRSPDPVLREALGRWVFRLHRREVARRRTESGGL